MKKLFLLIFLALSLQVTAQKLPFQGRLLNEGVPYNGSATMEFSIADPAWSETISDVSVSDGYYSVVLGESNPLPSGLYTDGEASINISVNSTALSPVTIYEPILADSINASDFVVIGANDENRASLGSTGSGTSEGYYGIVLLSDSAGNTGNFLRTRNSGGYLQLAQNEAETGDFQSAAVAGTTGFGASFMDLYGLNEAGDGIQLMVDVYATDNDITGQPRPDGYRRGGIDLYNYTGTVTHSIFSEPNGGRIVMNNGSGTERIFISGATGDINGTTLNVTTVNADVVNTPSDQRFKTDIHTINEALTSVNELRGVSYYWKDKERSERKQIGVIAQELEQVYPELVTTNDDGYKSVNYAQMTAVLIEAVKELSSKVDLLEKENSELKQQVRSVEQLSQDIAQLKTMLGIELTDTK